MPEVYVRALEKGLSNQTQGPGEEITGETKDWEGEWSIHLSHRATETKQDKTG